VQSCLTIEVGILIVLMVLITLVNKIFADTMAATGPDIFWHADFKHLCCLLLSRQAKELSPEQNFADTLL